MFNKWSKEKYNPLLPYMGTAITSTRSVTGSITGNKPCTLDKDGASNCCAGGL